MRIALLLTTLFICVNASASEYITLNVDKYGNWCKGNVTTKEKAISVFDNYIATAPDLESKMKLFIKKYQYISSN